MKTLFFTISFFFLTLYVFAQKQPARISQWAEIYFHATDVTSPQNWKNKIKSAPLFTPMTEHDFGFGFAYGRSFKNHLTGAIRTNILFHDYSATDRKKYSPKRNQIGIELETIIKAYALSDDNIFNAFVSGGLGGGIYSRVAGAYFPVGVGLTLTLDQQTQFILQSQYRASLTKDVVKSNLLFSLGLTQRLDKNPLPKTALLQLPSL
jgi:hypothetical protein